MRHGTTGHSTWVGIRLSACAAAAALAVAAISGCARTTVARAQDAYADASEDAQLDYWHTLPGVPAVSNNEGLHGVLLFADGADTCGSYEARVALLAERGWLVEGFAEADAVTMSRGTLAKALCHALEIRGGVMMGLTGKAPRYAVRELVYMELMAPGTERQVISGLDFVGVISKAQDYVMARAGQQVGAQEPLGQPGRGGNPPAGAGAGGETGGDAGAPPPPGSGTQGSGG